ncbi:MAG: hypothetical protein AAB036_04310 [Elusimicrobiota bacterium]
MKLGAALALLSSFLGSCEWLTGNFRLNGRVEIAPTLESRMPKTNSVLFIIARNAGGVPVAVHRIVNPQFPASFSMGPQDLLVPGIRSREPLTLSAQLNAHGNLGMPKPGDIEGRGMGPAYPGDRGAIVRLDKSL